MKLIEIEVYNYCNRKCTFCPNKDSDRNLKSNLQVLPIDAYLGLLSDLEAMDYTGPLSFSRYNEPFAMPKITSIYVVAARNLLPNNKLITNTNGDFIDPQLFEMFDEVTIMDYDNKGAIWWLNVLTASFPKYPLSKDSEYVYLYRNDKPFIMVMLDFMTNATIEDRGNTVFTDELEYKNERRLRTRPCYEPLHFIGVDYTGDIMPCCNLRHDNHKDFILGNIKETSIRDILQTSKRQMMILQTVSGDLPPPCQNCQKDPGRYTRQDPGIIYKGERK